MKLKWKILLLILLVTLATLGAGGAFAVNWMKNYALTMLAENEREKLDAIGRAFRQVGTRKEFENMGETARDAYLKYQFERCYGSGYGLLKNGVCIKNLTDYEITDPDALTGEYMVQQIGGKHVFLLKHPLEYPAGFQVLAVQDISAFWSTLRKQLVVFITVFSGIAVCAAAGAAVGTGRLLSGLGRLQEAAEAVGRGELGRTVGIKGRDEIGQVARAFDQMSAQVEEQVDDLHLLLGALTHEMKTPLTSIIGYSDTLLHVRHSEERKRKCLEQIYEAGKRMESLSGKLLNLIGLYENDAVSLEVFSAGTLFARLREQNEAFFKEKGVEWKADYPEQLYIHGDRELLLSLLSNLLQNACKASEAGETVELTAREGLLTVRDHGCGIPEKDLPHVKKAFYMADKSRSRSEGGSGLGLAISERIVKLHGGRMEIASSEGKGTQVRLIFPPGVLFTNNLQDDEDLQEEFLI